MRISILGIPIDNLTRSEFLNRISDMLDSENSNLVATVNAEFLVHAQRDAEFRAVLANSEINTADGIGVLWAAKYLTLPTPNIPIIKWIVAFFELIYTGVLIVLSPKTIRSVIKEKISGSEIIWSIAELATRKNKSIYLLGGYGDTAEKVKQKLLEKYPTINILGADASNPRDSGLAEKIKILKPDILLVAYGPVKQEMWIAENIKNIGAKLGIGLGGTFDYIAGNKPFAPHILRHVGLEWAFRLVTQPKRIKRIFDAVVVFAWYMLRHKIQTLKPYRKNVLACVVNEKNEILICGRKQISNEYEFFEPEKKHWQLPQGGVDTNESNEEALVRELKEEIGVKHIEVLGEILNAHTYEWPITMTGGWARIYRGQVQTLYFIRFHADHDEIKIDNDEFDSYKWVNKNELINSIHPVRKKVAEIIVENFGRYVK